MNRKTARVSIALCTYNGAEYLVQQMDSILAQTYPIYEIYISDDRSSDDTVRIIQEYADKYPFIHYSVNVENQGYIKNFSLAISKTTGDYVALADQDDIWTPDHIEKLIDNIGDKAICVGDCLMVDSEGYSLGKTFSDVKHNLWIPEGDVSKAYRIIHNASPYQGASMLIERGWISRFLPIPDFAGFHDAYLAACASLTKGIVVIPNIITRYRIHKGQVSKNWEIPITKELLSRTPFIAYSNKALILDRILKERDLLTPEGLAFIEEFKQIMDLDRQKHRFRVLRIKNSHYKEIYSCPTRKYICLRSIQFLLAK